MIASTINNVELVGTYKSAFFAFAERIHANTTVEAVKKLIETLPEFKALINISDVSNQSDSGDNSKTNTDCQEES